MHIYDYSFDILAEKYEAEVKVLTEYFGYGPHHGFFNTWWIDKQQSAMCRVRILSRHECQSVVNTIKAI